MSDINQNTPGGEDDNALASEYVLGVLEATERKAVEHRIVVDTAFAALVDAWEIRLEGLNDEFVEVSPPVSVKVELDNRLFGSRSGLSPDPVTSFWKSLVLWRSISAAAVAVILVLVFGAQYLNRAPATENLVASLITDGGKTQFVALYDPQSQDLRVTLTTGEKISGKDFELWLIAGKDAPVSLGLIEGGEIRKPSVPDHLIAKYTSGATLAISLEPLGGSTTGAPTGPVIAAGVLKKI